jgi:4-amino-4-deoxychorismate lyase
MTLPVHWVNEQLSSRLTVVDRGFLYGDCLFETMRLQTGDFHLLSLHRERLLRGCELLDIDLDEARLQHQLSLAADYAAQQNIEGAAARLTVSRGEGEGERGYAGATGIPTLVLSLFPVKLAWREIPGVARLMRSTVRLAEQPLLAGIKHGNRLEQVIAARQARSLGWDEAVLCNREGEVVSATAANIHLFRDGVIATPRLHNSGVEGTIRRLLLEQLAPQLGIAVEERVIHWEELRVADELFISNSLLGLQSVAQLDDVAFTDFALVTRLQNVFFDGVERQCS